MAYELTVTAAGITIAFPQCDVHLIPGKTDKSGGLLPKSLEVTRKIRIFAADKRFSYRDALVRM